MPTVHLPERAAILARGPDAQTLLQNVITTDLAALAPGAVLPGALLTPQGKILFDFLVSRQGEDGLRLDCRRQDAEGLVRRLTLYRLRAKVEISVQEQDHVATSWENHSAASSTDSTYADRRFPEAAQVLRHYGEAPPADAGTEAWDRLRIAHGVAEAGKDYAPGDAFPHDVLFDFNDGVGLKKGCYVGQEVVSRMHHRGTARRRLVIVEGDAPLPAPGMEVTADGRALGALGTVQGKDGLAILRIDRVADAQAAGTPLLAGDVAVAVRVPTFAGFSLSRPAGGAERD